ncbi:MAG TPA: TIGR01212 family radical SAM protein [Bdellovibrionota bacterium]|nr:TIGR01212 family radical SAM protein [Bdellovibrionota bacterium]
MISTERPQRRWNYFKHNLVEKFGTVVYKVGVDAGFDCPNRDGTKGFGGCAYCSQEGSLSPHQDPKLGIVDQIQKGLAFTKRRYGAEKYIAYFQAFTNTYAPVETLKERFEAALYDPAIVGLSIASRPDCINRENVEYMASLAERLPYFTVELGLQSAHQNRLEWVNRQETSDDYVQAMALLNEYKIPVITHVILGFPNESRQDMSETVRLAQDCRTAGIKLQMLHVIKKTKLEHLYHKENYSLMDMETYGHLVVDLVERLDPQIEIHRITGETHSSQLVAPQWVTDKGKFFQWFHAELERRDTWQGKFGWDSMPL